MTCRFCLFSRILTRGTVAVRVAVRFAESGTPSTTAPRLTWEPAATSYTVTIRSMVPATRKFPHRDQPTLVTSVLHTHAHTHVSELCCRIRCGGEGHFATATQAAPNFGQIHARERCQKTSWAVAPATRRERLLGGRQLVSGARASPGRLMGRSGWPHRLQRVSRGEWSPHTLLVFAAFEHSGANTSQTCFRWMPAHALWLCRFDR